MTLTKKKQEEIDKLPKSLDKDVFIRQATTWLRENGILSDYEINGMILDTYMSSKSIENVEMLINKQKNLVNVKVFVGRFSYLFKNKQKIMSKIAEVLKPYIENKFGLNIEVCLYKNY